MKVQHAYARQFTTASADEGWALLGDLSTW